MKGFFREAYKFSCLILLFMMKYPASLKASVIFPTASSMISTIPAYVLLKVSSMNAYFSTFSLGAWTGLWTFWKAMYRKSGLLLLCDFAICWARWNFREHSFRWVSCMCCELKKKIAGQNYNHHNNTIYLLILTIFIVWGPNYNFMQFSQCTKFSSSIKIDLTFNRNSASFCYLLRDI